MNTNYILDADVKGFFEHIDDECVVKFIGAKIKNPNILRLARKMLKAGIIEDFQYEETDEVIRVTFRGIDNFCYRIRLSLFYWLNRRSQKISYIWNAFNDMLKV